MLQHDDAHELLTRGLLLQYRLQELGAKQRHAMSLKNDKLARVDFVPTRLSNFFEKPAG